LGFGNPAKKYPELNPDPEDFGQTLGRYGIGDGFFVFLPAIGPTTLRDALGLVGDGLLTPRYHYVEPFEVSLSLTGFVIVNGISLRIGDYESVKDAALDPYQAFRNGYIQLRQSRLKK